MAIVLIVDDEYFIREVAISMVEELGHVVLSANGMQGAIVHLNSTARIDALITDVRLSTALLGGLELAQLARKLRPNLPVLYVTGLSFADLSTTLLVDGGQFLQKPYSSGQLQNAVQTLLAA